MIRRPGKDGPIEWTDFYESAHPEALGVRVMHGDGNQRSCIYVVNPAPMYVRPADNRRGERIGEMFAEAFVLARRKDQEAGWP